jgi:hypothetical protein
LADTCLVRLQVDKLSLQVLFPLLELLHHHRLNIPQPDGLPSVFAPLLLPGSPDLHGPSASPAGRAACEAFVDILLTNYRTVFAGDHSIPAWSPSLQAERMYSI